MPGFGSLLIPLCRRRHHRTYPHRTRFFSSSSSSSSASASASSSSPHSKKLIKSEQNSTVCKSIQQYTDGEHQHSNRLSRASILTLSASLLSALFVTSLDDRSTVTTDAIHQTLNSLHQFLTRGKQIALTTSVLYHSINSILDSINQEAKSTFEFRVSSLLADITASNASRRLSIAAAGNGAVLDWLLSRVSDSIDASATQSESARALSYLLSDPNLSTAVLSRPCAVPNLLRFIFSIKSNLGSLSESSKGMSMLLSSIMNIVTASCHTESSLSPILPSNSEAGDISFVVRVIESAGIHLDGHIFEKRREIPSDLLGVKQVWDGKNLHNLETALSFAAWAISSWAVASVSNRSRLLKEDRKGRAVTTCLNSSERSVKWHGGLVASLLLEDASAPMADFAADWCWALLETLSNSCEIGDALLARLAIRAFYLSVEKSAVARQRIAERGLPLLRQIAKRMENHDEINGVLILARTLNLLHDLEFGFPLEESQRWAGVLLPWIFRRNSDDVIRSCSVSVLSSILERHGPSSVAISQAWMALSLAEALDLMKKKIDTRGDSVHTQIGQANRASATNIANHLVSAVVTLASKHVEASPDRRGGGGGSPLSEMLSLEPFDKAIKNMKGGLPKFNAADSALATLKGVKALTEICVNDTLLQNRVVDLGVLCLLRRLLLCDDYEKLAASEAYNASRLDGPGGESPSSDSVQVPAAAHIRRHAARLLTSLSLLPSVRDALIADETWLAWLDGCARGRMPGCGDPKLRSYATAVLLNTLGDPRIPHGEKTRPRYDDSIFLVNPESPHWRCRDRRRGGGEGAEGDGPWLDVVFIHGLRGGPFKTWRIAENKYSTKSGLVEKIDEEAGMQGSFWPGEWLSSDLPGARIFTVKYKSNLTQWSGASLPLQEVGSAILEKLVAAGVGERPVVFVTHSLGGLVVKQMMFQAMGERMEGMVKNTVGIVFYSCPHFGSKLADVPWRMGLVLRPAPTIVDLRSGSPRLVELNDMVRLLHKKKVLEVLSFCETKVTPIVEGYGGWAFRMEIVPMESAYPGFGKLVVLESTDHINSCKPIGRDDPSYKELLEFLKSKKTEVVVSNRAGEEDAPL